MAVHIEITIPAGHHNGDNIVRILGAAVRAGADIRFRIDRPADDSELPAAVTP